MKFLPVRMSVERDRDGCKKDDPSCVHFGSSQLSVSCDQATAFVDLNQRNQDLSQIARQKRTPLGVKYLGLAFCRAREVSDEGSGSEQAES